MADIKIAFFDIDGTLLPFEAKHLPASTVDALARLSKNGVKTFIATGRPPVHLPYLHALDGTPFDGYVTMNGQYCYLADGELLYSKYIPAASLQMLLPVQPYQRLEPRLCQKAGAGDRGCCHADPARGYLPAQRVPAAGEGGRVPAPLPRLPGCALGR